MNEWNTQHNPPPPPDTLWVETVGALQKSKFIVYSNSIFGMDTHFSNRRTSPCYLDHSFCPNGHEKESVRWKGYLHAFSFQREEPVFVQLTGRACWDFLQKIGPGVDLRGMVLYVQRTKAANGRLTISQDHNMHVEMSKLPKPRDPRKSLEKLWKVVPIPAILSAKFLGQSEDIPPEARSA